MDNTVESVHTLIDDYFDSNYGRIHFHSCGDKSQPLLLIVHGSGPASKGADYLSLLQELSILSFPYYVVAIDCPGIEML